MKRGTIIIGVIALILCMFLVAAVSTGNIKIYDDSQKKATIKDANGIDIATIQLTTPQVYYVMRGKDRKVAEFEIEMKKDSYYDIFDAMEFYDLQGKKINKTFVYKYKSYEPYLIDVPATYKKVCEDVVNDNQTLTTTRICYDKPDTWKKQQMWKEVWTEMNPSQELVKGKISIGIFTDVNPGESVEWIPTMFGVTISEWAVWTDSFNTNLVSYYDFEDNTDKVEGTANLSTAFPTSQIDFKLDNSLNGKSGIFNDTACMNISNSVVHGYWNLTSTSTISFWLRRNYTSPTQVQIAGKRNGGNGWYMFDGFTPNLGLWAGTGGDNVDFGGTLIPYTWEQLVILKNSSSICLFGNGTLKQCLSPTLFTQSGYNVQLGCNQAGLANFDGQMDEIGVWNRELTPAEISDLYNGGIGIFYDKYANISSTAVLSSASVVVENENFTVYLWINTTLQTGIGELNASVKYNNSDYPMTIIWSNSTAANLSVNITAPLVPGNTVKTMFATYNFNNITRLSNTISHTIYALEGGYNFTYPTPVTEGNTFPIYFSLNSSVGVTYGNASVAYNGTNYPMTNVFNNATFSNYTTNITAPLVTAITSKPLNITYYINGNKFITSSQNQIIFNLLDLNVTYIPCTQMGYNFTLRSETNSSIINGTWAYTLRYGTKEYPNHIVNTGSVIGENLYICFNNSLENNFTLGYGIFTYSASSFAPRIYNFPSNETFSNATINRTIYLLSSTDGQYVTFQVLNGANQPIEGIFVIVENTITGNNMTATTDAAGSVLFFLNPLINYHIYASKTGYNSYSQIIAPTHTEYTIVLGAIAPTSTDYSIGITKSIQPSPINTLNNNTVYSFNFTILSTFWNLDSWGFTIGNGTNVFNTSFSTSINGGILNVNLDTALNKTIIMNYYWVINGTYTNSSVTWSVANTDGTQFSLLHFITHFKLYTGQGIFGLTPFSFAIIIFVVIFFIVGTATYKFGITSPAAIAGLLWIVVAIFDAGFGLIPAPGAYIATAITFAIFIALLWRESAQ